QPGEVVQVPVYYVGLKKPLGDANDQDVEFEVRIHQAGDPTTIDWASLKPALRPSWIAADAWDVVYPLLVAQIGPTSGDYHRMLSYNVAYLGRRVERVVDASRLFAFELQQAVGLSPVAALASVVDAALPAPGLAITFDRSFGNTITERYRVGAFGR